MESEYLNYKRIWKIYSVREAKSSIVIIIYFGQQWKKSSTVGKSLLLMFAFIFDLGIR